MNSIKELEKYIKLNFPNLDYFLIGEIGKYGSDNFGLEKLGSLFVWFYCERGTKENLQYFRNEEEAVKYAHEEIQKFISNYR